MKLTGSDWDEDRIATTTTKKRNEAELITAEAASNMASRRLIKRRDLYDSSPHTERRRSASFISLSLSLSLLLLFCGCW